MEIVLVGDDGSSPAARAVEWARRFAEAREAQLAVVRVTGTGQDAPGADAGAGAGVTLIHDSHPASGLMLAAEQRDADVVVLGRRGQGGFPSLPIGSTAHQVAASIGRVVVIVPPTELPADRRTVERVVVGLDGLPGSLEAAAWAARTFPRAQFTAVHALELAPAFAQGDAVDDAVYDRARARAVSSMADQWTRPLVEGGMALDLVVEEGGPTEVLLATAVRTDADLVVVGRRDHAPMRGTLGGVSQRVLAYAPCAAAMVPLPERA